jgi:ADP-ribosylation factor GTPase-activating protein 2/3
LGVHTTFVRSVDLDEWTQRQLDTMRLGGNGNCQKYFREHGLTDMHGKIEKKYTGKAAKHYRVELEKQVEIAAVQRGEGTGNGTVDHNTAAAAATGSLLENLSLQDQQNAATAASQARNAGRPGVATAVPTAKKASELAGAKGRLVVTPPTSGNLLRKPVGSLSSSAGMLRKPVGKTMNSKMLLKKPSGSGGKSIKLGVSKLSVTKKDDDANGIVDNDKMMGFDEEPAAAPEPVVVVAPPKPVVVVAAAPVPSPKKVEPPKSSMASSMSKMKNMNQDFFSGL